MTHYLRSRLLITVGLIEAALTATCIQQLLTDPADVALASWLITASLLISLTLVLRLRSGRARQLRLVALTFLMLLPGYLLSFAVLYLAMSNTNSEAFQSTSRPIRSGLDSMYFTVTVATTTGFGDIAPRTEAARTAVTIQMISGAVLFVSGAGTAADAIRRDRQTHRRDRHRDRT